MNGIPPWIFFSSRSGDSCLFTKKKKTVKKNKKLITIFSSTSLFIALSLSQACLFVKETDNS